MSDEKPGSSNEVVQNDSNRHDELSRLQRENGELVAMRDALLMQLEEKSAACAKLAAEKARLRDENSGLREALFEIVRRTARLGWSYYRDHRGKPIVLTEAYLERVNGLLQGTTTFVQRRGSGMHL